MRIISPSELFGRRLVGRYPSQGGLADDWAVPLTVQKLLRSRDSKKACKTEEERQTFTCGKPPPIPPNWAGEKCNEKERSPIVKKCIIGTYTFRTCSRIKHTMQETCQRDCHVECQFRAGIEGPGRLTVPRRVFLLIDCQSTYRDEMSERQPKIRKGNLT